MSLTSAQVKKINDEYSKVQVELNDLVLEISSFYDLFKENKNALDHYQYGLLRRIFLIKQCLKNFILIAPPHNPSYLPEDKRRDLNLFLHAFLINISGAINNLAWIWFYHHKIHEKENVENFKYKVNLFGKEYAKYLKQKIIKKCQEYNKWYEHFKSLRDPTAHRIPPYIIPYTVKSSEAERHNNLEREYNLEKDDNKKTSLLKEMESLRDYEIFYMDSFMEDNHKGPVRFYPQNISDTRTFIELTKTVFECLKS